MHRPPRQRRMWRTARPSRCRTEPCPHSFPVRSAELPVQRCAAHRFAWNSAMSPHVLILSNTVERFRCEAGAAGTRKNSQARTTARADDALRPILVRRSSSCHDRRKPTRHGRSTTKGHRRLPTRSERSTRRHLYGAIVIRASAAVGTVMNHTVRGRLAYNSCRNCIAQLTVGEKPHWDPTGSGGANDLLPR
ncbi:hypothetical protein BN2476_300193 [Paraburkholderia piptadeniae]|uniref:Uncharacterized protein n=1 Tax=Paraburkholderia piptadeniae TaxID=1701573 RepID=A0A1N7S314_9BURK|nr:hypothetical protein BN2476_300193 [Paraburkholderia piptadeniae]